MSFHHLPVLLNECLDGLNLKPTGVYLDCTLGGAGHSSEILQRLGEGGLLVGIDRDAEAIGAATARLAAVGANARFEVLRGNFHDAPGLIEAAGIAPGFRCCEATSTTPRRFCGRPGWAAWTGS